MSIIPARLRNAYNAYINSSAWKKLRGELIEATCITDAEAEKDELDLERGRYRCQKCGWNFSKKELEVHHLRYDNLGCESSWDLAVVCRDCHEKLDNVRAEEGRRKSSEAYEEAGFQAWAEKVYGEDWAWWKDQARVWEEFCEWLEDKRDDEWY